MLDNLAAIARIGFERRRRVGHGYGLCRVSDLEPNVHALTGLHRHSKLPRGDGLESGRLGRDPVLSDWHVEELVNAVAIGFSGLGYTGPQIVQPYFRIWRHRTGGISHRAQNGSIGLRDTHIRRQ